jgi:methyl-accepting chemotaxis protein
MRPLADASDLVRVEQPVRYVRESDGRAYGVVLIPLKSGAGASLGVIAIAKDFSQSRAAAGRSVIWQGLIAVMGVLCLAGIVIVVLRGFLLSPLAELNDRFAALARGAPSGPVEDADGLCDELRTLAEHHDAIRERTEKS